MNKKYCDVCECDPCDCGWGSYILFLKGIFNAFIFSKSEYDCERCGLPLDWCECHWGDR